MRDKNLRYFECEMRASVEDGRHILRGTPIVFEEHTLIWEYWDEVIHRGALDGANLKDMCLFVNHNGDNIALARSKNGKGTLKYNIDDVGMHIEADLDVENNTDARALWSAVERGDMSGMSFAFRIEKDGGETWTDVKNATEPPYAYREINKISIVHEVSVVNYPAYEATSVSTRSKSEEETLAKLKEMREERSRKAERDLELEKLKIQIRSKL